MPKPPPCHATPFSQKIQIPIASSFRVEGIPLALGFNEIKVAICDKAGNTTYVVKTVEVCMATSADFQYNLAGCVTSIVHSAGAITQTLSLGWDERYRLTSAVRDSLFDLQYAYDVLGRKVSRTEGGSPAGTEHYIYDGNQIVADTDTAGNLLRTYVWGSGIDNLLSMTIHGTTETNTYYAIKDHQNSVIALAEGNGTIVESYEFDAWGRVRAVRDAAGEEIGSSALGNRYCFQGREIDWATGLMYFRARWYNPETGRWLSKDPIGISGGLNLYVFCLNNPVNFIDPSGLLTLKEANEHWQNGGGETLVVDINTLDLSNASQLPESQQVNFAGKHFSSLNDALVYGTVTLQSGSDNTVIGGFDYYDFDIKSWSLKTAARNLSTIAGRIYARSGTRFKIEFTGEATLGEKNDVCP